ncbi:NADH-quinone oxidoreductase subunit J [Desertimonas flava]|jgi:NADH-quinone oxidoreductase subunit J|uniref:NADH-quinone oxidoreductase subunit J family protein n=1 Tax=Desertimonas flava TaxID=2064846 RepID=UPI000E34EE33|nr:NADH-quinone oxidoreductase subunit J [Desertimonas flava]
MNFIVFVIATLMVIGGAVGVIVRRHPVHAALSLVLTLFGVAVHFVSMEAHFLAAVQVIVYAGAIVVLFLFVIMLLGVDSSENLKIEPLPIQRPLAALASLAIVGLLVAGIFEAREAPPLKAGIGLDITGEPVVTPGAEDPRVNGAAGPDANIKQLGENLFSDHVLAFELTSVLLIVAVAGTVVMTRKDKRDKAGPS